MNPVQFQLYRFSFWLAPLVGLSFVTGSLSALRDPALAWMTWWGAIVTYGVVPIVDLLLGRVTTRFSKDEQARLVRDPMLRAMPWVCAAVWIATLSWSIVIVPQVMQLPIYAVIGFVVSLGIAGGILAINVGHELIHRNNRLERFLGGVLLSSVCYGVFKVEHVRGHHLRVATADDPATARLNETIYSFVPRAIFGTFVHAWAIDAARLAREGKRGLAAVIRNESLHWGALTALAAAAAYAASGAAGLLLFAAAGLIAIIELELVDYIEHYGLVRARDASGAIEPVRYEHSWDYAGWFTNALLLNLQRHSDHHAHGGRAFGALNSHPEAPQLPASYAAMILAAIFPPLYRRIIHPRLLAAN
ncbi:MAG: alkane 1-monooxygenase [Betaproteobacteria bacterium]|nr:MAG: alkane 1-monooxygenase [Betaproteobacteria bacterium]